MNFKKNRKVLRYSWIFFIVLISKNILGQTIVTADEYLIETKSDDYQWNINSVVFKPSQNKATIYPHCRGIDTILFFNKEYNLVVDTIFSRIPRNQEYLMTIGCCDDGFDICRIDKKVSNIDYDSIDEETEDSLFWASQEYGQIKFVILNKPKTDTLICIYGNAVPLSAQMITTDKNYGWLKPFRTRYSSNIDNVIIAEKKKNLLCIPLENSSSGIDMVNWDGELGFDGLKVIKKFGLRLFNKEKVIIEYDYLSNKMNLFFEDNK